MNDPTHLAADIMELRAYAQTKHQLDNAKKAGDEPTGPMAEWVWKVQIELAERHKRGR